MTHKQIWITIAEAYATPPEERTWRQGQITSGGLCWAFHFVSDYSITEQLVPLGPGTYWWPTKHGYGHRRKHDLLRSTFACLFAAMSKKEFDQLLEAQ